MTVKLGEGQHAFTVEVEANRVPTELRLPNAKFVAVLNGRSVVVVEPLRLRLLAVEDQIRQILNADWDPIGVADVVSDVYDGYIGGVYGLLRRGASPEEVAQHLLSIETDRMGYDHQSADHLVGVAGRLCSLRVDHEPDPESAA